MRATLGIESNVASTLKGLRHLDQPPDDGTPLGYCKLLNSIPRVARYASNPGLCDETPSE